MKKVREVTIGFSSGVAIGAVWGISSVILEDKGMISPVNGFFGLAAAMIVGVFMNIIFHELGHLEAGLLSGYKFSSFRIGSFTWINEKGKIKFKRYSMKGTGGQCLMIPPENKGYNYPVIMYNLGGIIMNLFVSTIMLILSFCLKSGEMYIVALLGYLIAITNGIPMKANGVANDGMNVKCLKKDPLAMQAFDCQLRSNALLMKGIRLKDMPKEWFEIPEDSNLDNINTGTMIYMQISRMLDSHDFQDAKEKIQWTLENVTGMLGVHKNEIKCELIFCYLILGEKGEAEKLYEYEMKKYIQQTASWPSRKRLMYAYYLVVEKYPEKAEKELNMFEKIKKTYPYKADLESEEELIQVIKDLEK